MKKLLFTLAVAGAMVAGAEDIESANVVGYNTLSTGYSYQMIGANFQSVGGIINGVTLGSLTGDFQDDDQIQVSYMDDEGYVLFEVYTYFTDEAGFGDAGFYDESYENANDTVIPRGSAVWFITSSGDPASVTTAGDVVKTMTEHSAFVEEFSMICSAYPIPFNPNAASVTWEGLQDDDQIQVSYMDEDGYVLFTVYTYFTDEAGFGDAGFYDESYERVEAPIAEVGQGFWLITQDCESVKLTETSPVVD